MKKYAKKPKRPAGARVRRAPRRTVEEYLDLPYSFTFLPDEDEGGFVVK